MKKKNGYTVEIYRNGFEFASSHNNEEWAQINAEVLAKHRKTITRILYKDEIIKEYDFRTPMDKVAELFDGTREL